MMSSLSSLPSSKSVGGGEEEVVVVNDDNNNDDNNNDNVAIVIEEQKKENLNDNQVNDNDSDNAKNTNNIRRSKRKRISTLITVDGHDVLTKNNYVVKGGSYEMGAFVSDNDKKPATKKQQQFHQKKSSTTTTDAASNNNVMMMKQPKQQSREELARLQHNQNIKQSIVEKQVLRQNFIIQHLSIIKPFMNNKTFTLINNNWNNNDEENKNNIINKKYYYQRKELYKQPDLIENGEMRDYQLDGLNFMINMYHQNLGMILGDEMGLGKTLQTISFLCYLKESIPNNNCGPSLVIAPLSVLDSWRKEIEYWAPSLRVLPLHASGIQEQSNMRHELSCACCANNNNNNKYDVIVTTYDMILVKEFKSMLTRIHYRVVVLDEGHKTKNMHTLIAQAVRKLHCEIRLLLTGTPLQNDLTELVTLLNWLLPDIFTNFDDFQHAFDITNNRIEPEKMAQAEKVLSLFMLRRLKDTVEKLMPKKIETKVYCPLSNMQKFFYKNILLKDVNALVKSEQGGGMPNSATSKNKLVSLFMQLRKACLHPYLFPWGETDMASTTLEDMIGASGKLAVLDALLISLFTKGNRVVLFSQFTTMLDILIDYCDMRGWKYVSFDGRTPKARRNYNVNQFNAPDSQYFIFLMSTRSGSMGLNLQTADTCILFDSDFNPQCDLQAQARVHRIGQTKNVHVYRLVAAGTIEERMVQRAEKKLVLDKMVNRERAAFDASNADTDEGITTSDMLKDIKFGCAAVFGDSSDNNLPTKKDIEYITDRSRTENYSEGKLKGNAAHSADTYDLNQKLSESSMFMGVDFKKLREQQRKSTGEENLPTSLKGIPRLWNEIAQIGQKRQIKNRLLMISGKNSGYGQKFVPVLASNNYDLESGESSVFARELSARGYQGEYAVKKTKRVKQEHEHQEWCQVCGDGGLLHLCSRCPISVHKKCWPSIDNGSTHSSCCHHNCSYCLKNPTGAGGLLYCCQSCSHAFCEDDLAKVKNNEGFRMLDGCERFEKLGFVAKQTVYIHCSTVCEDYAKKVWKWQPPRERKGTCPPPIDVSSNFGGNDATENIGTDALVPVAATEPTPLAVSTSGSSYGTEESLDDVEDAEVIMID